MLSGVSCALAARACNAPAIRAAASRARLRLVDMTTSLVTARSPLASQPAYGAFAKTCTMLPSGSRKASTCPWLSHVALLQDFASRLPDGRLIGRHLVDFQRGHCASLCAGGFLRRAQGEVDVAAIELGPTCRHRGTSSSGRTRPHRRTRRGSCP